MSCSDDLTVDDLTQAVSTSVLERVSGGQASDTNLWGQINRDNVTGLNLVEATSAPKLIKTWDDRLLEDGVESDVDDEMIIHVPFTQSVRLRNLLLRLPAQSHPNRPGRLRLYANIYHCPDFNDLESTQPIMDIDIRVSPPTAGRTPDGRRDVDQWALKVQRLSNVHSVTLYFTQAVSGQRSTVWFVGFKGDPKDTPMDLSQLGRVPAENAADSKVDEVRDKATGGYTTIR